ncbi:M28 family peptidase [Algoriphagus halophytocola]|uniref:M28 family peptidase n=1 Tax=Algoriphagus halophytocola TaxID=2991499 RepID=A0ABY6MG29_9BACT|nr:MULTISPECIES: M28 family peptidase [unclassified Algoriphagus]UZD22746.1 M28 family peptidase [Algoriphagus sp. TR-M5]WBL44011.1 M28 family peptidase [Algoriphagus sp. TR-M9]
MNLKATFLLVLISLSGVSFAQKSPLHQSINPYFSLVRPEFKADLAYETVGFVEQYWRLAGNTGFDATVYRIAEKLEAAGYVLEENASSSDRFTYRIETRKMNRPTWEPVAASLEILGTDDLLLNSETNRNMTYQYSSSTPPSGVRAEVVYISSRDQLTASAVKGKIIFSDQLSFRALQSFVGENAALGVLTYDMPEYLQPEKNTTSIQFRGLRYDEKNPIWAIALSYRAKDQLKSALAKGKVEVLAKVETKIYESEELTVVANVKGSELPLESLVFSAHIQEPGANDNATGVGTQLEMASITADLIKQGKLDLKRTLTFLWGDEIVSTGRYIQEKDKREAAINWGISLDMVGENTAITGGTFLIEKMPDPSAIWTRGEDKHSEWGGRPLKVEDMTPHYLNDFIISVFETQGEYADWVVKTNPFEGGSDHTPFLRADIPGLLLWHFTDQFYHTDNDRLDKVSQKTMQNVGTAALVSAYTLLNADEHTADQLVLMLSSAAHARLQTEFQLSKDAIAGGGSKKDEQLILDTWVEYYAKALDSIKALISENDQATLQKISQAKEELKNKTPQL